MMAVFEFLFKYRPVMFERGTLSFHPLLPWYLLAALLLTAAGISFLFYRGSSGPVPARTRYLLMLLRWLPLAVLAVILLQPVLILHSVVPQKNFLAVAYDSSKSMTIRDGPQGESRMEILGELLRPEVSGLMKELGEKFRLRFFRFSNGVDRTESFQEAARPGSFTDIAGAMAHISGEMAGTPLAGIVMFSDGADNRSSDLESSLAQLRARRIPIYPVGIGRENLGRDIEVLRATTPRKVLKDTLVEAEVTLQSKGFAGRRTRLIAKEGDRVLAAREVTLGSDDEVRTYKLSFVNDVAGPRIVSFHAEPIADEIVAENNEQTVLIQVSDEQPKVLYVEGEPRWIYAFLRRALLEDKNLHLVTLLRQADGKFLRQGIDDPRTLEKGFPLQKSELYEYKALILGSLEASFFSFDQLRLISDFVGERGGGFLMLGGKNSFGQGGYAGTPLEDVLPVALRAGTGEAAPPVDMETEFRIQLGSQAASHPITRIAADEAENRKRWEESPGLFGFNPTAGPKPGAVVLASVLAPGVTANDATLLAVQRFGNGKSVALTTGSVWRWRMEQDHRDNFHELFWRQLARWLVSEVPDALTLRSDRHTHSLEETVAITAEVRDPSFVDLNNAQVTAHVRSPSGRTTTLPLSWEIRKEGLYSARFRPEEEGVYEVEADCYLGDHNLGSTKANFRVGDTNDEFHNAALNSDLLRSLAGGTGGRYYTPADSRNLAEDISYVDTGSAQIEEKELWDMPLLFLLFMGAVSAEWILRKRKGLA